MTTSEVEAPEIVHCELCRLPHRAGVVKCEECEHLLGTPVDWKALDCQLPDLRMKAVLGIAMVLGMLALNVLAFGGAGYIVLLAPIYWTVMTLYRYRIIARRLATARSQIRDPRS
jgi:hypothetical protein